MKKKGSPLLRDLRENRTKWLMLVPAAVVVILMCYIPMNGIVLAFKAYNYHDGIFGSPSVSRFCASIHFCRSCAPCCSASWRGNISNASRSR